MATHTQGVPGYYVWEAPGPASPLVVVHLHLDVIDRLGLEIMRGFGAVPKRGAEVGGILLGTIEDGEQSIVRIQNFVPVECDYRCGPSYLLTNEDGLAFEDAWTQHQPDGARELYAVGYYRSHTREGMALALEDVDLMERYFNAPEHVALLVRPFATKVSAAGFFTRDEHARFPSVTPLEFPFRRRELTGEEPAPRRTLMDRRPRQPRPEPPVRESRVAPPEAHPPPLFNPSAEPANAPPAKSRIRPGLVWLPLSFVFLLLGVLLGFQAAMTLGKSGSVKIEDYSLALSATRAGENLTIRWNRDAPAVRTAFKGVLEIEDGSYAKPVELDAAHLQGGSITYRTSSESVRFRLTVNLNPRLVVTETLDWRQ